MYELGLNNFVINELRRERGLRVLDLTTIRLDDSFDGKCNVNFALITIFLK